MEAGDRLVSLSPEKNKKIWDCRERKGGGKINFGLRAEWRDEFMRL